MVSRIFLKGLELEGETSGSEEPAWYHFGDGKVRIFSGPGPVPDDPFVADYYLKDHLGNIMVVFRDDNGDCVITTEEDPENREVVERFMYYAFGMQWGGVWRPENNPPDDAPNRYRYNSKEWHFSTGMLDYGFRYYMPEIGRFSGVDPLADAAPHLTPYRYGFNNPLRFIDPDGLFEWPDANSDATAHVDKDGVFKRQDGNSSWEWYSHEGEFLGAVSGEADIVGKKDGPIKYALNKYAEAWGTIWGSVLGSLKEGNLTQNIEGTDVSYPNTNSESGSNIEIHSDVNNRSSGSVAFPNAKEGTKIIMSAGGLSGPFGLTYETISANNSKSAPERKVKRVPTDTTTSQLGTRIENFKVIHNSGKPNQVTTYGNRPID